MYKQRRTQPRNILILSFPKGGKSTSIVKLINHVKIGTGGSDKPEFLAECIVLGREGDRWEGNYMCPYDSANKGNTVDKRRRWLLAFLDSRINADSRIKPGSRTKENPAGILEPLIVPKVGIIDNLSLLEDLAVEVCNWEITNSDDISYWNRWSKKECEEEAWTAYKPIQGKIKPPELHKSILDMPNGRGYALVRSKVEEWIMHFLSIYEITIIFGHIDGKFVKETNLGLSSDLLDLYGKGKRIISQAIDVAATLKVINSNGSKQGILTTKPINPLETSMGSRYGYLANKEIVLTELPNNSDDDSLPISYWERIFPNIYDGYEPYIP